MNKTASVIKMHLRDKWTWFFVPSFVVSISFVVNLIVGAFLEEPLYTGGLTSVHIYVLVAGMIVLPQTFPFALGLSVRRTDYFWGTAAAVALMGLATSLLMTILSIAEDKWTNHWGVDLYFFNLPYLSAGNALVELGVHLLLLLHLFFVGFVIASMFRRFGRNSLLIFFAAIIALGSCLSLILTRNRWWIDVFDWLGARTAFELVLWLTPLTAVYFLLSYMLLRRSTV
ncbi:hypothetical protein VN24_12000 [Paenibacillus beijingensis]|uniref:Uncharacterized protein n=2 Tax=Paenibacillus beijingensis TaxID=1126833 RepID=A0A0D5NR04_9BACL|nr:hypothetical protein VN24_12000 [Paenibacillus beijingensis]